MKVSDYIIQFLADRDVRHIFEVAGGTIGHLLDSAHSHPSLKLVSMHHEQAAAFAADATGRVTGIPGVAMATSGPGATNLLTGIGSAYFDSSPALFITGQVNRSESKGARPIRQLGFQETDIVSMARVIAKAAWSADCERTLPRLLEDAFIAATSGRPGPVLLDVPMDVQRGAIETLAVDVRPRENGAAPLLSPDRGAQSTIDCDLIEKLLKDLNVARCPLILAGGGLRSARAIDAFRTFVSTTQVPVIHSLLGVDALGSEDDLKVGLIGTYGNRWANHALADADFILVLGSRLDIRQTGSDTGFFKGNRIIYHVDCEPGEINNRVTECNAVVGDLKQFLQSANELAEGMYWLRKSEWLAHIRALKERFSDISELAGIPGINPNVFMHELNGVSRGAAAFVADVGQHQMWAAQSLSIRAHQRFITSGGMGAMGFGLPAAIGTCLALDKEPVVMIAGDGGFQLNIQELETVARNRLPLKMVILDNGCHGMVRQFQETYFDARYQSTVWGYSAPDFAKVAEAYGVPALTLEAQGQVPEALAQLWQDPESPTLLRVMIDRRANAYPKIAFGHPLTQMEPHARPVAL